MVRKLLVSLTVLATVAAVLIAASSPAEAAPISGTPVCRATALRIGTSSPVVSNPAGQPCVGSTATGGGFSTPPPINPPFGTLGLAIGGVEAAALFANTLRTPEIGVTAEVGHLRVFGPIYYSIDLAGARAEVDYPGTLNPTQPCTGGSLHPHSSISWAIQRDWIELAEPVPLVQISTPLTIPLLVGTLYLNQTIVSGGVVTQRAAFLDLPGTANDVVVAEAMAGCVP